MMNAVEAQENLKSKKSLGTSGVTKTNYCIL